MNRLRTLRSTVGAVARGLFNMAIHPNPERVELAPGDEAPDFSLEGSDGRTYRLRDFRGRSAVVIAWFPKAFTGG